MLQHLSRPGSHPMHSLPALAHGHLPAIFEQPVLDGHSQHDFLALLKVVAFGVEGVSSSASSSLLLRWGCFFDLLSVASRVGGEGLASSCRRGVDVGDGDVRCPLSAFLPFWEEQFFAREGVELFGSCGGSGIKFSAPKGWGFLKTCFGIQPPTPVTMGFSGEIFGDPPLNQSSLVVTMLQSTNVITFVAL